MCGFTGFFDRSCNTPEELLQQRVTQMSDAIVHRGPDDSGCWVDAAHGIALGFRRLAILDLSPAGHQPMISADGRYVMVFNGEVYNFAELRKELAALGHSFRGTSDTEIMLAAVVQWGLNQAVQRFNGMFAFALWDRQENCLHLVRDRLGIKPLYYGWMGNTLLFGSELKALRAHPAFRAEIDRGALALFMRYKYVPAPYTIYHGVHKLPPANILTLRLDGEQLTAYWSAREVAERGVSHPFEGTTEQACDELDALLRESVQQRMIADVPLGAFLSGGVDSSLIVALMQAQSQRAVKTFTVGYREPTYNEAGFAHSVADYLHTDHTDLFVTPEEAQAVIPLLPQLYDEPFADSSQIPTYLLAKLTRQYVTVSLSGDGGDELFGGYLRYGIGERVWRRVAWIPPVVRRTSAAVVNALLPEPDSRPQSMENYWQSVQKAAEIMAFETPEAFYHRLVSTWKDPAALVLGGIEPPTILTDARQWSALPDITRKMMYFDLVNLNNFTETAICCCPMC